MAARSGTAGSVVYMTGGTTTVTKVKEWSLDFAMNPIDHTGMGEAWEVVVAGISGYTGSFTVDATDDVIHGTLRTAALARSEFTARFYTSGTSYYTIGTALFTGMSPSLSYDGIEQDGFDFKGSGALAYTG